jgi:magnesium chelatase family protein
MEECMLAVVSSHAPLGIEGELVSVEVDIRRGLPGIDIVGLPDGAVRESRERVRVAIRNSGFAFPADRILVSLAPAGIRKEGASFDLPIALGVLLASGQIGSDGAGATMVLGELNLGGGVRPVNGVLSAVGSGLVSLTI